ncbi:hypothetical protein ColLi_12207 [Colletotrichum liriopes]|uniref:Uncharacterized protein n=1 Tax=Colletotrichum liriopes TaxID=708192 RepID=A0AA37GXY4_9PEZI|nr:hypothetical protein ColLi_12207 [Colletotrichum liriopes]
MSRGSKHLTASKVDNRTWEDRSSPVLAHAGFATPPCLSASAPRDVSDFRQLKSRLLNAISEQARISRASTTAYYHAQRVLTRDAIQRADHPLPWHPPPRESWSSPQQHARCEMALMSPAPVAVGFSPNTRHCLAVSCVRRLERRKGQLASAAAEVRDAFGEVLRHVDRGENNHELGRRVVGNLFMPGASKGMGPWV